MSEVGEIQIKYITLSWLIRYKGEFTVALNLTGTLGFSLILEKKMSHSVKTK